MRLTDEIEQATAKDQILALREMILERGGRTCGVASSQLAALLEACPDPDLAATAFLMSPRPRWVKDVLA